MIPGRLLGLAMVAALVAAPAGIAAADSRPTERFLAAAEDRPVPGEYIVVFADQHPAALAAEQVAADHGAVVRKTWRHAINGALLGNLSEERARAVAHRSDVRWVEANQWVSIVAMLGAEKGVAPSRHLLGHLLGRRRRSFSPIGLTMVLTMV